MTLEFKAQNDLERQLLAAQQGEISEQEFMHALLTSQVFMPIHDKYGIGGLQGSASAVPLSLPTEDDFDAIILFTSPERAKPFLQDFPGYEGGLLAEFTWVLEKIGAGHGISLNPGLEAGLDMAHDTVAQLAAESGE